MPRHQGKAVWEGNLASGQGQMSVPDADIAAPYSAPSRFEGAQGTSPEALIGAAHAGCFSMALAKLLADAGFPPRQLETTADLKLAKVDTGFQITSVRLNLRASVPDIDDDQFADLATKAKENCPVSQLLRGAEISLDHELER